MRISNREKIMLYILGILVVGFGYYQFIYIYQLNSVQAKTKQENDIEQKYNVAKNTINSLDSKKSDMKILKARINDTALAFYPTISEEHIILELDTLLKDSGLDGGIKFNSIVSDSVEGANKKNAFLPESSLQEKVDEYNDIVEDKNVKKNEKQKSITAASGNSNNNNTDKSNSSNQTNTSNNSNDTNSSSNTNDSSTNTAKESKDKKKNTLQYVKAEVSFEGSYTGLNKFLTKIGQNEKKIVVNSIKIEEDTLDSVKGKINVEIYAVPKIDDELESYLIWSLNNTYGKSVPFSRDAASGNIQANKDINDFEVSVKPTNSDLPAIILGKANDDGSRENSVYADSNSTENAEIELTQDGGKYYYKYKTSKGTFPIKYDGIGAEFAPKSNNITLNILSENRVGSNDKSELKLKIVNKTDRLVVVNINGDDKADPRVTVDGDGKDISVNKK